MCLCACVCVCARATVDSKSNNTAREPTNHTFPSFLLPLVQTNAKRQQLQSERERAAKDAEIATHRTAAATKQAERARGEVRQLQQQNADLRRQLEHTSVTTSEQVLRLQQRTYQHRPLGLLRWRERGFDACTLYHRAGALLSLSKVCSGSLWSSISHPPLLRMRACARCRVHVFCVCFVCVCMSLPPSLHPSLFFLSVFLLCMLSRSCRGRHAAQGAAAAAGARTTERSRPI